ncbi:hypothetical protein [Streptomonospora litoralis]|uniref:Uncharacterized protein n=1 Tax=Streptomonospora litoralis TaxID=2498135 RepID=A0A4P6PVT0_9ACTN|nr:hypothetical protein [Streptomonospora litoralis]QBI52268.1 hypothetical protein EKD16_02260 [Streptomonospora litoralis]
MTPQAEQLVLQYLSRVADAAYGHVTARGRTAYLADLRSRIHRACAAAGAETSDDVRRILRGFGRPAELVARELAADFQGAIPPETAVRPAAGGSAAEPDALGSEGADAAANGAATEDTAPDADGSAVRGSAAAVPANRPVRLPPPWRATGGRDADQRTGVRPLGRPSAGASGRSRGAALPTGLPAALRRHPPEALAVALYAAAAGVGVLAGAWLIGAAVVALSRVWTGLDKAVGVGVPVLATLVGMAVWESGAEYIYIDEIIWESLADTGIVGLRLAAAGACVYLALRLPRPNSG